SIVWPVTASLAVAGQRTSSRLITGPVFAFRTAGVPKNFICLQAVDDARLINVVRRHLQFNAIADGKSNKSFAHFPGNVREDKMLIGERKAARFAGHAIHHQRYFADLAMLFEKILKIVFSGLKREITYVQFHCDFWSKLASYRAVPGNRVSNHQ